MKKIIILVSIVLIVAVSFFVKPKQREVVVESKKPFTADKMFDVKGLNYSYDVKEIRVKLNDKVKINFTNTEGMHDFRIDELGVKTNVIKEGVAESAEFVADKAGTFEYYCSVGKHRANGMWGKLIVE